LSRRKPQPDGREVERPNRHVPTHPFRGVAIAGVHNTVQAHQLPDHDSTSIALAGVLGTLTDAGRMPYAPAVVRLDEGVWMMSAVIGCEPDALHEDMRLAMEFHPASDEITLPYFAPAIEGQP